MTARTAFEHDLKFLRMPPTQFCHHNDAPFGQNASLAQNAVIHAVIHTMQCISRAPANGLDCRTRGQVYRRLLVLFHHILIDVVHRSVPTADARPLVIVLDLLELLEAINILSTDLHPVVEVVDMLQEESKLLYLQC